MELSAVCPAPKMSLHRVKAPDLLSMFIASAGSRDRKLISAKIIININRLQKFDL